MQYKSLERQKKKIWNNTKYVSKKQSLLKIGKQVKAHDWLQLTETGRLRYNLLLIEKESTPDNDPNLQISR